MNKFIAPINVILIGMIGILTGLGYAWEHPIDKEPLSQQIINTVKNETPAEKRLIKEIIANNPDAYIIAFDRKNTGILYTKYTNRIDQGWASVKCLDDQWCIAGLGKD